MSFLLRELAQHAGVELVGDGSCEITHIDPLQDASEGAIAFLADNSYQKHLKETGASAVILSADMVSACPVNALVTDNPTLAYARIATLMFPQPETGGGVHPSAVVDAAARVHESAWIGPCSVVEAGTKIEGGVHIGPGCQISRGCRIGAGSRLVARVTLCHDTLIGERVLMHPGVVIGSDGFGLANDNGVWEKVPQLGSVRIEDDVEIGANTTIDRGALSDTVIEQGVKLDNQIQIAHNVRIGSHTAIAGCAGIAGSATIGSHCTLGGGVGVAGHLEIGDNVHFTGMTLVTRSISEPGVYSGNLPAAPNGEWRRIIGRIRRMEGMMKRIKALEKIIQRKRTNNEQGGE